MSEYFLLEVSLSCLLTREALHRSLLACCAQVILLCYSHVPPMQRRNTLFIYLTAVDLVFLF